jgi:hypothetical protein
MPNPYIMKKGVSSIFDLRDGGLGSGGQVPFTTGSYFYVHSGTGSNASGGGSSPSAPLATIDYAIGLCTANKGDVIVVMPGHAENIAAATTLALDVAGVQIVGVGRGRNRPVLTFTNTAGKIPITGASCRMSNLALIASVSAVVTGISVEADDVELDNLYMGFDETGDDFAIMVLVSAKDRLCVRDSMFVAENTAGCNAGIQFVDALDTQIVNNVFEGDYTTAVLNGVTTLSTGVFVVGNIMRNSDTTAGVLLTTAANSTGLAAYNSGGTLYSTNITAPWANTGLLSIQNFVVNVVTETAGITPATAST